MKGFEIHKEFIPKLMVPSIKELAQLIRDIKKDGIDDDFRAYEGDEEPGILLTIGCSYDKPWSFQTGDNSFSGGAYGHRFWGIGAITRTCNSVELAKEIIDGCQESTC